MKMSFRQDRWDCLWRHCPLEWHVQWLNNVPRSSKWRVCQYALFARAGTDCNARVVRSMVELEPTKTLLSIDGISAFDHIKRMLETFSTTMLLWPLSFLSSECSTAKKFHVCVVRRRNAPHEILQGEGGGQGNPLMPALSALGQHAVLTQVHATLSQGEMLFAYPNATSSSTLLALQRFSSKVRQSLFRSDAIQVTLGQDLDVMADFGQLNFGQSIFASPLASPLANQFWPIHFWQF